MAKTKIEQEQILTVKRISDDESFCNLKDDWAKLIQNSNVEDISLTWDWLYTWWIIFKEGRELYILAVYSSQELIGIAPILRRKVKYFRSFSINRIELLGTGEDEKDEICSDYLDFIAKQDMEREVASEVFNYLTKNWNEWDELYFADILDNSKVLTYFFELLNSARYTTEVINKENCPYIYLPSQWEELLNHISSNFRKELNKKKRRLEKQAEKLEYITWKDNYNYKEAFENVIELHEKRWIAKGRKGSFASNKFMRFHQELLLLFMPKNGIRMYFLKINDKLISCRYCFAYKNKFYDYLTGYDVNYETNYSPGNILLAYCIEDAIIQGARYYDFYKGTKGSYKYRWANSERFVETKRITSRHRNNIKWLAIKLIEKVKKLKLEVKRFRK